MKITVRTISNLCLPMTMLLASQTFAGEWKQIGKTGCSWGGATVYSPSRKQVLRWGGISGKNDVLALDLGAGKWTSDYPSSGKKRGVGGGLYAPNPARWSKTGNRPELVVAVPGFLELDLSGPVAPDLDCRLAA